eukprot:IDg7834t1
MRSGERMMMYINRVRQIASIFKSMSVDIDDKELAMAVLNSPPFKYLSIIVYLDDIGDDDDSFTLERVSIRLFQEEKRSSIRNKSPAISKMQLYSLMRNRVRIIELGNDAHTVGDLEILNQNAWINMECRHLTE